MSISFDNVLRSEMSISGNTVATWRASGRNAVYLTNMTGNTDVTVSNNGLLVTLVSGMGFDL